MCVFWTSEGILRVRQLKRYLCRCSDPVAVSPLFSGFTLRDRNLYWYLFQAHVDSVLQLCLVCLPLVVGLTTQNVVITSALTHTVAAEDTGTKDWWTLMSPSQPWRSQGKTQVIIIISSRNLIYCSCHVSLWHRCRPVSREGHRAKHRSSIISSKNLIYWSCHVSLWPWCSPVSREGHKAKTQVITFWCQNLIYCSCHLSLCWLSQIRRPVQILSRRCWVCH